MNETFSTVIAILLCVFLMIIAPVQNMKDSNNRIEQTYIQSKITNFVENSRNTGIISKKLLEDLYSSIYGLLRGYKVSIVHSTYIENETGINDFIDNNYSAQINEILEQEQRYLMKHNDYLNITVTSYADDIVAVYGGGIKREGSSINNETK